MSISIDFKNAVTERRIILVRVMLKESLISDPSFVKFNDMYKYAMDHLDNLLIEFDDEKLDYNEANWSEDYMNKLKVELMGNFSEERINHLKQICNYLYQDRIKENEAKRRGSEKGNELFTITDTQKKVATGAVVGGAVIAGIGVAVTKPVVIVAGVLIAAVGVGVLIASKE